MSERQYLYFAAPIYQQQASMLSAAVVEAVNDPSVSDLYITFSTPGGNVSEGVALHHLLKSLSKEVTIHGIGNVDSIGLTVLLGAKTRLAVPGSRFLFHPVGIDLPAGRADAHFLMQKLQALRADQARLAKIYADHTSLAGSALDNLFEDEHMHDCGWALENGFIHEARDLMVPGGARLRHVA